MHSDGIPALNRSRFTEILFANRDGNDRGFKEWIFIPGMLFNAMDKWWGDLGTRSRPHEGLDLCLYRTIQGGIVSLDERIKIPSIYDGLVVKIIDDFLGKSVIIEHTAPEHRSFCSIFGHTRPDSGIKEGSRLKEGEFFATIADTGSSGTGVFPHLHLTIGLISKNTSYDLMDWETIANPDMLTLLDPLVVIGGNYVIQATLCLPDGSQVRFPPPEI